VEKKILDSGREFLIISQFKITRIGIILRNIAYKFKSVLVGFFMQLMYFGSMNSPIPNTAFTALFFYTTSFSQDSAFNKRIFYQQQCKPYYNGRAQPDGKIIVPVILVCRRSATKLCHAVNGTSGIKFYLCWEPMEHSRNCAKRWRK
jgi:hypothetical protein